MFESQDGFRVCLFKILEQQKPLLGVDHSVSNLNLRMKLMSNRKDIYKVFQMPRNKDSTLAALVKLGLGGSTFV